MSWHDIAHAAIANQDAFMRYFPQLPKKVRSLVKHLDGRFSGYTNAEDQLYQVHKSERQLLKALVDIHQSFPPNTRFPTPEHNNKYAQFSKAPPSNDNLYMY